MPARTPTPAMLRQRDYAFLIERLIPRRYLTRQRDEALMQALARGARERLFAESVSALRELVARGLYVEVASRDPRHVVFRSTRTRDRVHLVQPTAEQQASRPTPGTVSEIPPEAQPRTSAAKPPPQGSAPRKATSGHLEKPGEPLGTAAPTTAKRAAAAPPTVSDAQDALKKLEPILQLVGIEGRLAHLAERLRRILAQVEKLLPGSRVRLWHLEGATDEELGNGPIRTLSRAALESTPHFREALRTLSTRYATAASGGDGMVAAAVPLRVQENLWGVLEITWSRGTVQSVAAFAPLLQPLARLVELAIRNQTTLEKLVFVDPLTGVYNRAFYERQLTLEMERAHRTSRKFALLVMDVDDFKSINDRYGHRAGDLVLSNIAGEVRARMRKIDLLFRYGGEEFVLLLPGAEQEEARRTAERLRAVVSEKRYAVDGAHEPLQVTVSIGVAIYPDDSRTHAGLFKHADAALYHAKEQGKNRVAYS